LNISFKKKINNEEKKKASKEVATDKNEVRSIWVPILYMKVEDVDE